MFPSISQYVLLTFICCMTTIIQTNNELITITNWQSNKSTISIRCYLDDQLRNAAITINPPVIHKKRRISQEQILTIGVLETIYQFYNRSKYKLNCRQAKITRTLGSNIMVITIPKIQEQSSKL